MSHPDARTGDVEKAAVAIPRSRLTHWAIAYGAPAAVFAWMLAGLLYVTLPPSTDQFMHAYMGWRLLQGDVPYRDFIDPNWPGVMGLHALAVAVFGVNLWSWRVFDFLLFAVSAFFLADLARMAAGRVAMRLSVILLPLVYAGAGHWLAGQHDMSAAQCLAVALWCHVRAHRRGSAWWSLATGAFIGLAMLSKPTVGVAGMLLPVQALWLRTPLYTVVRHTAANAVGLCLGLGAAAVAVLAAGTSPRDLVDGLITFNAATQFLDTPVYAKLPLAELARVVPWELLRGQWVLALGGLPAVYWLLRADNRSIATTTLPLLWLSGLLSCMVQSRGWPYHLAPSILAMAVMMPISIAVVADGRVRLGRGAWHRRAAILLLVLLAAGLMNRLQYLYRSVPQALASGRFADHLARFPANDGVNLAEAVAFVRRLDARPPGECVLALGTMSAVNYLSMRHQGTRFYYFPFLYLATPPMPLAERWTELWEVDLRSAQCHYVLIADWVRTSWLGGPGRGPLALRQYLGAFRESGTLGGVGGMTIYERR